MPGVVFIVCIPTANYERDILNGNYTVLFHVIFTPWREDYNLSLSWKMSRFNYSPGGNYGNNEILPPPSNNFNISPTKQNTSSTVNTNSPGFLRLELELRDKNAATPRFRAKARSPPIPENVKVPMEKVKVLCFLYN